MTRLLVAKRSNGATWRSYNDDPRAYLVEAAGQFCTMEAASRARGRHIRGVGAVAELSCADPTGRTSRENEAVHHEVAREVRFERRLN